MITKDGQSILPHQNWRGQFSRGTYANGASSDCAPGQTSGCQRIPWPGWRTTAWHFEVQEPTISVWFGGLVDDMRDASGQMYKRNRYYDPATGQFTQQDPIGIAGGLNTYGFADGDPVSYSDPYGLCPTCENQATLAIQVQGVEERTPTDVAILGGVTLLGAGASLIAAPEGLALLGAGLRRGWRTLVGSADDARRFVPEETARLARLF